MTEFLEGETLRTRLDRGPLSWRKAAELGALIADGLAAAHAKGIIHRDLKPANIFLTNDGRVKILDFGIAKLLQPPEDGATGSEDSTVELRALGTTAYMTPEQVAGRSVDIRTDIFALGVLLHETITGRRLFLRASTAETVAAILTEDADALDTVPPGIRRVAP